MNIDVSKTAVNTKENSQRITRQVSLEKIDRVTRSTKLDVEYRKPITEQVRSPLATAKPRPASAPNLDLVNPSVYLTPPPPVLQTVQELQPNVSDHSPPVLHPILQPGVQINLQPNLDLDNQEEVIEAGDEDLVEEVFDSDQDQEMAEERSIAPSTFSGAAVEDAEAWLRHFQNFCHYKGFNDAKALALFKVLLTGNAAIWMDALQDDQKSDYKILTDKFSERYKSSDLMQYRSAKEIFTRRQRADESVDDFCAAIKKLATSLKADDKLVQYALLSGLKSNISNFVIQRKPKTYDEILDAARLAELTIPERTSADSTLSEQLADVQTQVHKLASKWENMAVAWLWRRCQSVDRQGHRPGE